jgi:hypothetical protein
MEEKKDKEIVAKVVILIMIILCIYKFLGVL